MLISKLFKMAPTRKAEATIRTTLLNNSATKAAITSSFEYCSSLACDKYLRKMKNRPNSNSIRPKQGRIQSSISNGIRSFSCVQSIRFTYSKTKSTTCAMVSRSNSMMLSSKLMTILKRPFSVSVIT